MARELAGRATDNPEAKPKQIIESRWVAECPGPTGVVPKGKEPGRNVTADVFADISRDVDCNNFKPDKTCEITETDRCIFTRTPNHQIFNHTLSHIENTPNASRISLHDALGLKQNTTA